MSTRGPESTFIASVHAHLPDYVYAMKNHNEYTGGIADVWYSGNKADLWIEYKFIALPALDKTVIDLLRGKKPDLSPLQQVWLRGRYHEGRNVAVIVGFKGGGVLFRDLEWEAPHTTAEIIELSQSRKDLAKFIAEQVSMT